ncbi:diguanylate cyclase [Rhizobium sp. XQZ8]|uniref:GGDEF domain-containing protein n=1 Tax=Rhizobium populisoli TaxID=2859785 RepID=UPI001CA50834|nr:GGDEF domain-containing protein [Rhizobium populisoli]MBW6423135.1 diguanylate cyclase [Rhizobium populisoli]
MNPISSTVLGVFSTSLTVKVFTICFVSVHVPLIVFIAYLASGFEARPGPVLGLLIGATVVGTGMCLSSLWWLIRPLRNLVAAVKTYHVDKTPIRMDLRQRDEIGLLATAVTTMVAEMETMVHRLRHQAMTDPLTGLGNRRWLGERTAEELARADRQSEPVSIVVFDLDRFKAINDNHGHDVGDKVLVTAAEVIRGCIRSGDLAARIGGEEFCILMPRAGRAEATAIAERLREALARTEVKPLPPGRMTASFGVYQALPGDGLQQMLRMSDKALYEAKASGRNCVRQAYQETENQPDFWTKKA